MLKDPSFEPGASYVYTFGTAVFDSYDDAENELLEVLLAEINDPGSVPVERIREAREKAGEAYKRLLENRKIYQEVDENVD